MFTMAVSQSVGYVQTIAFVDFERFFFVISSLFSLLSALFSLLTSLDTHTHTHTLHARIEIAIPCGDLVIGRGSGRAPPIHLRLEIAMPTLQVGARAALGQISAI